MAREATRTHQRRSLRLLTPIPLARLRIFFRFDRRLLGELPRRAWQTVFEVHRAVFDRQEGGIWGQSLNTE